jgi:hypothetical protein
LRTFGRVPCLCLALLSLVAAVGCGTGGSPILNHFTGNFSNASLKGTYVYQVHAVALVNGVSIVPYRQVGVFTADGAGGITGTDDSSVSSSGTAVQGSYQIASDGTGQITFNTSSLGAGAIQFAVTMVSTSKVQMIENDPSLNAAGVAELQDPTAAGTTPGGTFVFRLHQEAAAQNPNGAEASQVGGFSLTSGSGSGAMDQILGTTSSAALTSPNLTVTFNAPAASGRGTAALLDTTANFTTHIVYYIVNSGELALLVSDAGAIGSGSAEAQTNVAGGTGLSGSYAFGSRGDDLSLQGLATVGQFTAAPGTIAGVEDLMQDGAFTPNAALASTCFAAGAAGGINGRVVATNGSGAPCSGSTTQIFWMVNPSRAFFLDDNGATFEDGTADLQTTNPFSASSLVGQYVIDMDGLNRTSDLYLSRVGLLRFDGSSNLTLNEFANEFNGGASPGLIAGTYSVGANGRIVANFNSNPPLNLVMYPVSSSQAYALQQDSLIITSGTLELQH